MCPSRLCSGALKSDLFRCDNHHHLSTLKFRESFDLGDLLGVIANPVEYVNAKILMRHLATSEPQRDLHLITLVQEFVHVTHFHLVVVVINVRAEFNLLDFDHALFLLGLVLFLLGFVFEFAVVEDLADWWIGVWRYLDKVEPIVFGLSDSDVDFYNAKLLAIRRVATKPQTRREKGR